jgi:hypothetical protein
MNGPKRATAIARELPAPRRTSWSGESKQFTGGRAFYPIRDTAHHAQHSWEFLSAHRLHVGLLRAGEAPASGIRVANFR